MRNRQHPQHTPHKTQHARHKKQHTTLAFLCLHPCVVLLHMTAPLVQMKTGG